MKPGILDDEIEISKNAPVANGPSSYGMAEPFPRAPPQMAEMIFDAPAAKKGQHHHELCRICQSSGNAHDLIRPCTCSDSSSYVHRACLNRWRAVSPFPDALTKCEHCGVDYKLIYSTKPNTCGDKARAGFIIALDFTLILAVIMGLWILCGYAVERLLDNPVAWGYFKDLPLWDKIFLYGFITFFAILGILGLVCFCCSCGGEPREEPYEYQNSSRGDCYWACCGPMYVNGYYYPTPYSHWSSSDVLCCYICLNSTHGHSSACDCTCRACVEGLSCGVCEGGHVRCEGGGNNNNGQTVLLVILIVILVVLVTIGIIFGSIVVFMLMNKVIRKQMSILDRKSQVGYVLVADLDDPDQVAQASKTESMDVFSDA
jgi:hypothetical protein